MKIIEVTWTDACVDEGKIPLEVAEQLIAIERKNYGFLIKETEKEIILCACLINDLFRDKVAYESTWAIPKGCILQIRELTFDLKGGDEK